MKILHLSDIHSGYYEEVDNQSGKVITLKGFDQDPNLVIPFGRDEKKERNNFLKNHIQIFLHSIELNFIKKDGLDLVIISGDISITGRTDEFNNLLDIIEFFIEKNVSIQIVPGNHDLNYEFTKKGQYEKKFNDYLEFVRNHIDVKVNKVLYNYEEDFSFYINKNEEIVIIGINSAKNSDHLNKKNSFIEFRYLKNIFSLIETQIGDNFQFYPKIIISHYGRDDLKNSPQILKYLNEYNTNIIFSGHHHQFDYIYDEQYNIHSIEAGSLLSPIKSRILHYSSIEPVPCQFNYYQISDLAKFYTIQFNYYEYSVIHGWTPEKLYKKQILKSKNLYLTKKLKKIPSKKLREHLVLEYRFLLNEKFSLNDKKFYDLYSGILDGRRKYFIILSKNSSDKKKNWTKKLNQIFIKQKKDFLIYLLDDIDIDHLGIAKKRVNRDYIRL